MIERIKIENFKSIRELNLELKPMNILVGANGAGKSNFLSFFKLTSQIHKHRLQEYITNNIDKLLYFGRKRSNKIFGFIDFDNKYAFSFFVKPSLNSNLGVIKDEKLLYNKNSLQKIDYKNWITLLGTRGDSFETSVFGKSGNLSVENNKFIDEYNNQLDILSDRFFNIYHFHDTGNSSPMKQMNKLNDNRYLREDGKNLASFLYYLQKKHSEDFKKIERHIRSVGNFFDKFDLKPDRLNERQIELRWLDKGSTESFDAYDLSDGTLRFMALTTLLMQPDLPKTIIIDEPELGLHPFAINKLAAMMKRAAAKGSQVIVSTQSTDLVDNFDPEDVIAVDRKDHESVFERLNAEALEVWLEDYKLGEIWSKNIFGAMP